MNEDFFKWYDKMGRPTLRYIGIGILTLIGLAIAVAFLRWSLGAAIAPLPGEALAVAALPYLMQAVDHVTRMIQRNQEMAFDHGPRPA